MAARKSTRNRSKPARKRSKAPAKKRTHRWSQRVMQTSDALDLERGVFSKPSGRQIALSLKRSAEASHRRKSDPFRSAMSMLNFHVNRAGKNLTAERRRILDQAKQELRRLFHRDAGPARRPVKAHS